MSRAEILLETGTNEIEILKFTIYDELYGINVAKVREIMMSDKVKPVPHSHPAIEGILKPRDAIFTAVDLPYYLTGKNTEPAYRDLFMVTSFNRLNIAFRVHSVVGIQRMSWEDIKKPDRALGNLEESVATGITESPEGLVVILDFEKILADIAPEICINPDAVSKMPAKERENCRILFAEDSALLAKLATESLQRAGYIDIVRFNNGQELWKHMENKRESVDFDLVITDIEMPQMDGHRLTKLIKDDKQYKEIPVVIFSSLINFEMHKKGRELGADAQLSKPEIAQLVSTIDAIMEHNKKNLEK